MSDVPDTSDIGDQIATDALTGDAERQIGDRRVRKEPLKDRIEALKFLQAEEVGGSNPAQILIGFGDTNVRFPPYGI
jgi:hypothetical protein